MPRKNSFLHPYSIQYASCTMQGLFKDESRIHLVAFNALSQTCNQEIPKSSSQFGLEFTKNCINSLEILFLCLTLICICGCPSKQPSLYYVRTQGWMGSPENGNFTLLYVFSENVLTQVGGWFKKASKHPSVV